MEKHADKTYDFVLYEIERRKTETEELTLIEYKRSLDGRCHGFPRLAYL